MTDITRRRQTRQRQVILDEIMKDSSHPTAEEVYRRVKEYLPRISLATVYRNLEFLSQEGMIQKLDAGGTQRRFDCEAKGHYHVRCIDCGRVDDVGVEPIGGLIAAAEQTSNYDITEHKILFQGKCPKCKSKY